MSNEKKPYLPKVRTDYYPTQSEIENSTGVDFSINLSNPAVDPIVCNNIANQEFDYTESMFDVEKYDLNTSKTEKDYQ